jgi:hypothetical protein
MRFRASGSASRKTIAAMGVIALDKCLRDQRPQNFAVHFHRQLTRVTAAPWVLATSEDYRYRETEGGAPTFKTRMMHAYMDQIVKLATFDQTVRTVLLKAFGMLVQPSAFFRPNILCRVIQNSVHGKTLKKSQNEKSPIKKMIYETSLERRL